MKVAVVAFNLILAMSLFNCAEREDGNSSNAAKAQCDSTFITEYKALNLQLQIVKSEESGGNPSQNNLDELESQCISFQNKFGGTSCLLQDENKKLERYGYKDFQDECESL